MKNLLILLLFISTVSYSQIPIDSTLSPTISRINDAVVGAWPVSGTDTYTSTISKVKLKNGKTYTLYFTNGNTGSATYNLNGSGAVTFKKWSSGSLVNLVSGDISPLQTLRFTYNGTYLVLQSGGGSSGGGAWGTIIGTLSSQTDLQSALDGKQPIDSDLTSIAGLSPTNDDIIQRKAGAWTNRTIAQIKTDLGIPQTTITGNAGTATALATPRTIGTVTGDATSAGSSFDGSANNTNALTLATVNSNVGSFGSATQSPSYTVNAKGLITAASNTTITPAVGSITGLGTGIATALAVNIGSAGAPVLFNGAGGTPSSLTGTNITGTASGLTAGNVTTNANLTGAVTSSGNATTLGSFSSSSFSGAVTDEIGTGNVLLSDLVTNAQTSSYTLVIGDKGKFIEMNSVGANNLTIPPNSSVAFPIGSLITITQYGAGLTSIVAGSGVTIRSSSGSLNSPAQYAPMQIKKIATDEWYLWNGSLTATAALSKADATNITMSLTGTPSSALLAATTISLGTVGSNGDVFIWSGTNAETRVNALNTTRTALWHLKAGTATVSTAPLKFTSGTNLTTPEAGAVEYNGTNLFFTPVSTRVSYAFDAAFASINSSGTFTTTLTNVSVYTITPTGDCTMNATGGIAGQRCSFVITTSGTTSWNLTFGTNYKSTGVLATGTVSAKVFTVTFAYDGTNWNEVSRTTAM